MSSKKNGISFYDSIICINLFAVVEWYCNGRPIQHGHRFKTTYDFGFVALDILYAHAEDTGTYMCKAKNAVGEAVTTCNVSAAGNYFDFYFLNSKLKLILFGIVVHFASKLCLILGYIG